MRGPVEFGLILALTIRGLAISSYRDLRSVARAAEELGFDSVWPCDREVIPAVRHELSIASEVNWIHRLGPSGCRRAGPGTRPGLPDGSRKAREDLLFRAGAVMRAVQAAEAEEKVAGDDRLWSGPTAERVRQEAERRGER